MRIEQLINQLPTWAKDIKLNMSSLFSDDEMKPLSKKQIFGIALASSYAAKNDLVVKALLHDSKEELRPQEVDAVKAAAAIMAMNNVYYRYIHLVKDQSYAVMPAKLRMNFIANPGIDKVDFELYSLAVSAINGCGMCMDAHTLALAKAGLNKDAIQFCIRIAAILNAFCLSLDMISVS